MVATEDRAEAPKYRSGNASTDQAKDGENPEDHPRELRTSSRRQCSSQSISTTQCSSTSTVKDGTRSPHNDTTRSSTLRSFLLDSVIRRPFLLLGSIPTCSRRSMPWGFLPSATKRTSSTQTSSDKRSPQPKSAMTTLQHQHMRTVLSHSWPTASSAHSRLTSSTKYMRSQMSEGAYQSQIRNPTLRVIVKIFSNLLSAKDQTSKVTKGELQMLDCLLRTENKKDRCGSLLPPLFKHFGINLRAYAVNYSIEYVDTPNLIACHILRDETTYKFADKEGNMLHCKLPQPHLTNFSSIDNIRFLPDPEFLCADPRAPTTDADMDDVEDITLIFRVFNGFKLVLEQLNGRF
ncbi:hypothetical protein F2Q69_00014827 [Brassica cretica]|uniref:Arabidopsis retrotransposon Orf1 C-terminal domain-containing protein n=1 Tax=Brassica cretica TaxID=69181 RepID=A0A8S9QZ56_BRACR|nr:hypothetical protein F2Q69_00014827 [Brassica cretica]